MSDGKAVTVKLGTCDSWYQLHSECPGVCLNWHESQSSVLAPAATIRKVMNGDWVLNAAKEISGQDLGIGVICNIIQKHYDVDHVAAHPISLDDVKYVPGVERPATPQAEPGASESRRCPVCLSDSRAHGNMRPCMDAWHAEQKPWGRNTPAAVPQASAGLSDEEIVRRHASVIEEIGGDWWLTEKGALAAIAEVRQRNGERIAELTECHATTQKLLVENAETRVEVEAKVEELTTEYHRRGVEIIHWNEIAGAHLCRAEAAEARADSLGEQLEFDRTQVASGITAIKKAVDSRHWLTEGRGSCAWDDDRWHGEFRAAAIEILAAVKPLAKIAADWSNCPQSAEAIAKARIDLKDERDSLAATLEKARETLSAIYDPANPGNQDICECADHIGPDCCNHSNYYCPHCLAGAALASLSPAPGTEDKAG